MSNNIKNILIVGSGYMADEYLKVFSHDKTIVSVIGRGKININKLKRKYPHHNYYSGGLSDFLLKNKHNFSHAINAVNVEYLYETTKLLIQNGIKEILLEKPGALHITDLKKLKKLSDKKKSNIFIAYNRRFYNSIMLLNEKIKTDGGIRNIHFDFTEWTHRIDENDYSLLTLKYWLISNSTHVIDTVFFLAGTPKNLYSLNDKKSKLSWHPSASVFVGCGSTTKDILFSYNSNWTSSGRWKIEVVTDLGKYILAPMEELKFIERGTINEIQVENLAYNYDNEFKPGIYLQTNSFLESKKSLCTLDEQIINMPHYSNIANY